jgi:hypothetical protein
MSDKDQELLYGIATSIGKWLKSSLPKEIVVKKVGALLVSVYNSVSFKQPLIKGSSSSQLRLQGRQSSGADTSMFQGYC